MIDCEAIRVGALAREPYQTGARHRVLDQEACVCVCLCVCARVLVFVCHYMCLGRTQNATWTERHLRTPAALATLESKHSTFLNDAFDVWLACAVEQEHDTMPWQRLAELLKAP